jgi:Cu/Ag efflux pump CusA
VLRRIVEFSVRSSGVVIALACLAAAYGIYVLSQAKLDVFPEFVPPRGSGFVETRNQRIVIRTEGQSLTPEALGEAVFAQHGNMSVRLKDVARVVNGAQPQVGGAAIRGQPAVVIIISSQYGANTLVVSRAAEQALHELMPIFAAEGITFHPALFRASAFIDTAVRIPRGRMKWKRSLE